jgi:DNA repair protein RadC
MSGAPVQSAARSQGRDIMNGVAHDCVESRRTRNPSRRTLFSIPTIRVKLVSLRRATRVIEVRSPDDVWRIVGPVARTWDRERFVTLILDGRSQLLGIDEVSVGTVTATLVHPREVLKAVILANGVSFVVVHNHPGGNPTPSREDVALTARIKAAADIMGLRLDDHVVVASEGFHSMSLAGQL